MTNVRTAVAKVDQPGVGALVDQYRGSFATVLPTHIKADQWIRVAQGVLRRDAKLAKVAKANPPSLLAALLDCARLGLEPGDTYHLVPFGGEIVGIVDYTGEIELMYRAGEVTSVKAEIVWSNDDFEYWPGEMDRPHHRPKWFGERGEMIGAYAYATLRNGSTSRVVLMSRAEIDKHKAVSRSANDKDSMWQKWPEAAWLKTVTHQLRKWVPTSAEYRTEVLRSQAAVRQEAEVLDVPVADDDVIEGEIVPDADGVVDNGDGGELALEGG